MPVAGLIAILVAALLAAASLLALNRVVRRTGDDNEQGLALEHLTVTVGVIYAIALAFVVVVAWERVDAADEAVRTEAAGLAEIDAVTGQLPEEEQAQVTPLIRRYAQVILDQEWSRMRDHEMSNSATAALDDLRAALLVYEPQSPRDDDLRARALDTLEEVYDARKDRASAVSGGTLELLLGILLVMSLLMIGLPFLFRLRASVPNLLLLVGVTVLIVAAYAFSYQLSFPYSGTTWISPDPFREVLAQVRP